MPLVGGGGAGNIAGGNPAGTGTSLNYIGNHAYAYSGNFSSTGTDDTTYLEFDLALNQYIVCLLYTSDAADE